MFAIVLPYLLQPLTHGGIAAITRADALEEVLAVQVLEEVVLFGQCQERLEPVRQGIWRRDAGLRDIHIAAIASARLGASRRGQLTGSRSTAVQAT